MIGSRTSGGGGSPSGWMMLSRYCFIECSSMKPIAGSAPALTVYTSGHRLDRHIASLVIEFAATIAVGSVYPRNFLSPWERIEVKRIAIHARERIAAVQHPRNRPDPRPLGPYLYPAARRLRRTDHQGGDARGRG